MNEIFFIGKVYEKETGLYYFNARYYDSELGRFISRDPIGIVDDVNLYVYVGNNPLKFVDPTGLIKMLTRTERFWELHKYIIGDEYYQFVLKSGDYYEAIDLIFKQ